LILLLLPQWALADIDPAKLPPAASAYDFAHDVQPLLEQKCVSCHNGTKHKGNFRIDTREQMMKGGDDSVAVVAGKSAESPLIHYVARLVEDMNMPPKAEQALKPGEIGLLRGWIDHGAPWPEGLVLSTPRAVTGNTALALNSLPPAATRPVDFVKDIQPIFAAACYDCHGPHKQESEFRLDHKPTVFHGGELGPAIVPGKSAESLLVQFVGGLREEGVMPKKGDRLSAEQIGLLRAWIDQGAEFPDAASVVLKDSRDHWAFKPPVKAALPSVKDAGWVRNDIDRFVLARMEKEGLAPAPEAPKETLLRRLSLDLIGLPPTPEELKAFLDDQSPDAYQKQVDRLLASPHYGERWGRHWLDAARYADSDGYEKDKPRWIWFYRDWVIDAFNRDLPYDQFIIEQIAGDQLPHPTQDQIVATGFLRNSLLNEEGGVDPEQFRMEEMFDRLDTLGKAVLGLGVNCCQCHNHKYDPLTQEEYYRIFAFLNNDTEGSRTAYTSEQWQQIAAVQGKIHDAETGLRQEHPDWATQMAAWEDAIKAQPHPDWTPIQISNAGDNSQRYTELKDLSLLAQGYAPTKLDAIFHCETPMAGVTAFRLELMNDANLAAGGPGRSFKGTCALTEFAVDADSGEEGKKGTRLKIASATADFGETPNTPVESNFDDKSGRKRVTGPIDYAIDGNDDTAWGMDEGPGRHNLPHEAVFVLEKPIAGAGQKLTIHLDQKHGGWNSDDLMTNNLGRFRISVCTAPQPKADPIPKRVRELLEIPRNQRTESQTAEIFSYWRTTVPEWKDANDRIAALWKEHPDGKTTLVLTTREDARETHLLKRGDWLKPGKPVRPGVFAVLNPLPADAPPTRLTLAHWLADRRSPTTARVMINRIWQAYFGIGIVSTSEDFGTQSEPPSHPELLDWLACEFMDEGWSIKHMQRLIVNSATYRQSSKMTPEMYQRDPYNRLLARGPRFRVEGEIVRDIQLSVSGLLNPRMGGMPTMPPAPVYLFQPPASYAPFPWVEATGEERYRRAVYTWRRRSTPYPMLQTFDTPDGSVVCARRSRSNTPLQALMTLNESVAMDAARAFARCILEQGGPSDAERIGYAFRRALSRDPSATEQDEIMSLIARQQKRIAEGIIDPWELATGVHERPETPPNSTPAQLAAYTVVSRVLLNLDETITKE
jgi:mono/diheme cytochrome c family protein